MKQCPTCKTTYTDETLRFCLADGTTLTSFGDEQATFVRPTNDPMRVQIPQDTQPSSHFQPYPQSAPSGGGSGLKIALVVGGLLALALAVVGAGAAIYYISRDGGNVAKNGSPTPSPSASPSISASPSPKDDTADLKNQIANLEKMINEQKNQNRPANSTTTAPTPAKMGTTAHVNSPGDGFLALRSFPSSEVGTRVAAIPHGASVSIAGCLNSTRVGNKTGRWCRANYNGYTGWVFDAWLNY